MLVSDHSQLVTLYAVNVHVSLGSTVHNRGYSSLAISDSDSLRRDILQDHRQGSCGMIKVAFCTISRFGYVKIDNRYTFGDR